jgi:hypothetical protein
MGGVLCAMEHVVTPEPSFDGWHALCVGACGGARALWHRKQIWSREGDLLSLVHRGTWSTRYRQ